MAISAYSALWFLPFALPICIWVAWNDMKFMKIPNMSVLALMVVFVVIGLIALPFTDYLWRISHFVVILAIGFIMNLLGRVGAGDAKFAAAAAPFIHLNDVRIVVILFAAVLLASVTTHRTFRRFPKMRPNAEDWESWTRKDDFPMGLALGGTLFFYLMIGAVFGS